MRRSAVVMAVAGGAWLCSCEAQSRSAPAALSDLSEKQQRLTSSGLSRRSELPENVKRYLMKEAYAYFVCSSI